MGVTMVDAIRGTPRAGSTGTRGAAFSLVELTMVMVIIAILAAMAVPRFANSIARSRVDAAARRITADIALVQRNARTCSQTRYFAVDIATHRYFLQTDGTKAPGPPCHQSNWGDWINGCAPDTARGEHYNCSVRLGDEPYMAKILGADFGGDARLGFDGFGMPDSAGTITIGVGPYTRTLTINGSTGKPSTL